MTTIARITTNSLFHIDRAWFETNGRNLREEMHAVLCDECRARFPTIEDAGIVDQINPQTAQVKRIDALQEALADHCGLKPEFIAPTTPLTAAVFRALLANDGQPMSPEQIHQRIHKSNPAGILKLVMGGEIENGIVPFDGKS